MWNKLISSGWEKEKEKWGEFHIIIIIITNCNWVATRWQ